MGKSGNVLLAEALAAASSVAVGNIVESAAISDRQRTLLVNKGYLKKIVRGWYLLDADLSTLKAGESALWFESLWAFVGQFLASKYEKDYWLSPEASLDRHTANNAMPQQMIVYIPKGTGLSNLIELPNRMSLLVSPSVKTPRSILNLAEINLNVLPLEDALTAALPKAYHSSPLSLQLALNQADQGAVADSLLHLENVASANRIIGGYEAMGMKAAAKKLITIMDGAGYAGISPLNPFEIPPVAIAAKRGEAPSAVRVRLLWQQMRNEVVTIFEDCPPIYSFKERQIDEIIGMMDNVYVSDAYHSLSIEGYKVTPELVERVARGDWSPETIVADKEAKDALAAKGYHLAFKKLEQQLTDAHSEPELDLGYLVDVGLTQWYTALFTPCVDAGIITRMGLAGYRKGPVYIRSSMHVPPASEQLADCVDALKELVVAEENAAVRAVLGHLFLGYIHPFPDGNGRTARFLMNFLLVIGGYDWAVIKVETRQGYLAALESASVGGDIAPFARFVHEAMTDNKK